MLKRMTEGHTVPGSSSAAVAAATAANGGDSDDDDNDADDEGFLGSYRRRRLEQLKATAGRPQFGQIVEAERATFVSAVDTEDPRTSVVVHLYEPYIDACRRMNRFLEVRTGAARKLIQMRLVGYCCCSTRVDMVEGGGGVFGRESDACRAMILRFSGGDVLRENIHVSAFEVSFFFSEQFYVPSAKVTKTDMAVPTTGGGCRGVCVHYSCTYVCVGNQLQKSADIYCGWAIDCLC